MLRKTTILIVILMIVLCISAPVCYAYNVYMIDYWESNTYYVCRWHSTPTIAAAKMNNNILFFFAQGYSRAINQWPSAGIALTPLSGAGGISSADIRCFGDTISNLQTSFGVSIPSGTLGVTYRNYSVVGGLSYSAESKTLGEISNVAIVLIVDCGMSEDQTKKTFTHEVGHALGWAGHSINSSDVMCQGLSSLTTLSLRDKRHLKQIYDLY